MDRIFIVDTIENNNQKDTVSEDTVSEDIVSEDTISQDNDINIYEEMMKIFIKNNKQNKLFKKKLDNREIKIFRRDASWLDK